MPPLESGVATTECHAWDAKQCCVVTTMRSAIARRQPSSRGVPALDGYTSHSSLPSSSAGIFPRSDTAARLTNVTRKSLSRRTYASGTVSRTIKGLPGRNPSVGPLHCLLMTKKVQWRILSRYPPPLTVLKRESVSLSDSYNRREARSSFPKTWLRATT